jgi:glutathione S-transferase
LRSGDACENPLSETNPTNRNDRVFVVNPRGKVPVLILPDGEAIFDSGAICDHLDTLGTVRLIPNMARPVAPCD